MADVCWVVSEEDGTSIAVEGSVRSIELVLEDAVRQGVDRVWVRVPGGAPIWLHVDIPWRVWAPEM